MPCAWPRPTGAWRVRSSVLCLVFGWPEQGDDLERARCQRPAGTHKDPSMWKQLWKTWTIDKPAAFGVLLWDVLVVRFAAFLDRLTVRRVIAFIPVLILGLAYAHSIPIPPELMLV